MKYIKNIIQGPLLRCERVWERRVSGDGGTRTLVQATGRQWRGQQVGY
jgi:hypothetical protein